MLVKKSRYAHHLIQFIQFSAFHKFFLFNFFLFDFPGHFFSWSPLGDTGFYPFTKFCTRSYTATFPVLQNISLIFSVSCAHFISTFLLCFALHPVSFSIFINAFAIRLVFYFTLPFSFTTSLLFSATSLSLLSTFLPCAVNNGK